MATNISNQSAIKAHKIKSNLYKAHNLLYYDNTVKKNLPQQEVKKLSISDLKPTSDNNILHL